MTDIQPGVCHGPVACLGEVLLRLTSADGELLAQSAALAANVGGAEANVAASLACLGAPARLVTVLPDNPLGLGARDRLRAWGVDTSRVMFRPGRMGLYFLTPGAVLRPSDVLYDRAGSAFVDHIATAFDWDAELAGVSRLHVSGVTPATGPGGSRAALESVAAAVAAGVPVSFDGNFRGKLWAAWEGSPRQTLRRLFEAADLVFADDRDIALILDRRFSEIEPEARRRAAAAAAFEAFPRLQRMVCTTRRQDSVSDHSLSAVMFRRTLAGVVELQAGPLDLRQVVDRVGGGDAFAAGILFGLGAGWPDAEVLAFGLAAAGLKHSVRGDVSPFDAPAVRAAMGSGSLDIRR